MNAERQRRILVAIPTISHPERVKLEGILAYAHERKNPRWQVELDSPALFGAPVALRPSAYDGVIAYVGGVRQRRALVQARVPVVLIEDLHPPKTFACARHALTLHCDHRAEGRTAAEHFLSRHFRAFAWVGTDTPTEWSRLRLAGYADRLAEAGFAPAVFSGARKGLSAWLGALPRPCAVFTACDFCAREVVYAAAAAGRAVPETLSVLGVDNDEAICTTVSPALSSLPTNDWRLGYCAGRLLNELLQNPSAGGRVIPFFSRAVVPRQSTDADAVADPVVAATLHFARNNLASALDARHLARRAGFSKRMLQLRVERALGHPLGEEIRRLRLSAAANLLANASLPVEQVAASCGYSSASHLALRFRESFKMTPLAYRTAARSATASNSAHISAVGLFVSSETTTVTTKESTKPGASS